MHWEPKALVVHNWPQLEETPDGTWQRRWDIVLQESALKPLRISQRARELSIGEAHVGLHLEGDRTVIMEVITARWGWDDDLYFYSYHLLQQTDETLGTILTIQGQPRDVWNPWLNEKLREKYQ